MAHDFARLGGGPAWQDSDALWVERRAESPSPPVEEMHDAVAATLFARR
jgi:hypothetical protein